MRTVNQYFKEWKKEAYIQKIYNHIQLKLTLLKKKQSLIILHKFYLNNKRDTKIRDIARLKLIKNTFQKCFKLNHEIFQKKITEI